MNDVAEIGEEVIYTGDLSFSTNEITTNLMKKNLVPNNHYIISGVRAFPLSLTDSSDTIYYRIMDINKGFNFWAPCESFRRDLRKYIKETYNLK